MYKIYVRRALFASSLTLFINNLAYLGVPDKAQLQHIRELMPAIINHFRAFEDGMTQEADKPPALSSAHPWSPNRLLL